MLNKQKEDYIMKLLKVDSITIPLYKTSLGNLELKRNKEENNYVFTLDSVPVDSETQKELSKVWGIN